MAVICGVGRRNGSDPALLWVWLRPAAAAPMQPLAWEPPYAVGVDLKKKNRGREIFRDLVSEILNIKAFWRNVRLYGFHLVCISSVQRSTDPVHGRASLGELALDFGLPGTLCVAASGSGSPTRTPPPAPRIFPLVLHRGPKGMALNEMVTSFRWIPVQRERCPE